MSKVIGKVVSMDGEFYAKGKDGVTRLLSCKLSKKVDF